jgi:hypothetical protein
MKRIKSKLIVKTRWVSKTKLRVTLQWKACK